MITYNTIMVIAVVGVMMTALIYELTRIEQRLEDLVDLLEEKEDNV